MHLQEEKENFCNAVRNEVKASGLMDTADTLWEFFIDKVGRQIAAWAPAARPCLGQRGDRTECCVLIGPLQPQLLLRRYLW